MNKKYINNKYTLEDVLAVEQGLDCLEYIQYALEALDLVNSLPPEVSKTEFLNVQLRAPSASDEGRNIYLWRGDEREQFLRCETDVGTLEVNHNYHSTRGVFYDLRGAVIMDNKEKWKIRREMKKIFEDNSNKVYAVLKNTGDGQVVINRTSSPKL